MKVFISSSRRDSDFARKLESFLQSEGHEVQSRTAMAAQKRSVLVLLSDQMQSSDLFVIIWGRGSLGSRSAENELLALKMLVDTDNEKFLLPIVLDGVQVPPELAKYNVIRMESKSPRFEVVRKLVGQYPTQEIQANRSDVKSGQSFEIDGLKKAHADGKLTLVCGAGISIGASIPPWGTLLDRLLDAMLKRLMSGSSDIDAARSELRDIRENSSLIAGRYLKNVLQDDFQEEVRRALYLDSDDTCDTIDAIVELSRPKRGRAHLDSIITFNFDDLLEQNFKSASIEHRANYSEGNRSKSTELPIFHVHGYLPENGKIGKENQLVFSEDSYHDQFVDPFSWSNLTQLSKFSQNTCLFVGLSLTDPNLRRLLDVANRRDGDSGARHYAILKRNADSSKNRMMESLREQDAASLGITILWVDEFSDIPKIIKDLA